MCPYHNSPSLQDVIDGSRGIDHQRDAGLKTNPYLSLQLASAFFSHLFFFLSVCQWCTYFVDGHSLFFCSPLCHLSGFSLSVARFLLSHSKKRKKRYRIRLFVNDVVRKRLEHSGSLRRLATTHNIAARFSSSLQPSPFSNTGKWPRKATHVILT